MKARFRVTITQVIDFDVDTGVIGLDAARQLLERMDPALLLKRAQEQGRNPTTQISEADMMGYVTPPPGKPTGHVIGISPGESLHVYQADDGFRIWIKQTSGGFTSYSPITSQPLQAPPTTSEIYDYFDRWIAGEPTI